MSPQRLTRDEIERAQSLVVRIQGMSSCQISADESGEITEVHVVATIDKSPKLIARDVESCLKAEMGLDVDHRKIGVVMFDSVTSDPPSKPTIQPPPNSSSRLDPGVSSPSRPTLDPAPGPRPTLDENIVEFPVEEYPSRFAFQSVNLFVSQAGAHAEVELIRDTVVAFGSTHGERPSRSSLFVIAEATLRAVSEFLDESTLLCLGGLRRITVGDDPVIVVIVDLIKGRDRKSLAGASLVDDDENQTVVFATLDAVNRILGKLDFKNALEYRIK